MVCKNKVTEHLNNSLDKETFYPARRKVSLPWKPLQMVSIVVKVNHDLFSLHGSALGMIHGSQHVNVSKHHSWEYHRLSPSSMSGVKKFALFECVSCIDQCDRFLATRFFCIF